MLLVVFRERLEHIIVLKIGSKMKKAFSLIEMVVVVTIIAIMVAVAATSFEGMNKKSRDARKIEDLGAIQKAMELAYDKLGEIYPLNRTSLVSTGVLEFWPATPQGVDYTFNSIGATGYCLCTVMETNKGGNSTANNCTSFTNSPDLGTYYCVKNLQ